MCLRAWKDICAPKKDGGLGIRNFQAVNQGLILMAAWRIADNPNDLLHKVVKAKYFHDTSIWRPNPNIPKSAFWASVLKVLVLSTVTLTSPPSWGRYRAAHFYLLARLIVSSVSAVFETMIEKTPLLYFDIFHFMLALS
jgi:hypothetical protein